MSPMDWEGAAKRDYVRQHGAVPYWDDLPKPKSLQTPPAKTKTGKLLATKARDSCKVTIELFRKLPPAEQAARRDEYVARVRQICAAQRAAVPASRRRFAVAIDGVERALVAEIEGRRKPPTLKAKPALKKKQGRGPVLPEKRPAREATEAGAKRPAVKLPVLEASAAFAGGVLYASWDDHAEADRWRLVVRGRDRKIRRVLKLGSEALATQVAELPPEHAPYDLQIVARKGPKTLAHARLKAIAYA